MPRPKGFVPDQALLQAMDIFWKHGYAATSMDDLVHAMGISRASLYATFGDKHALYIKAVEAYRDQVLLPQVETMAQSGAILLRIRELASGEMTCGDISQRSLGCFLTNCVAELGPDDEQVRTLTENIFLRMIELLRDGIAQEQKQGLWPAGQDSTAIASLLLTCLMGIRVLGKSGLEASWITAGLQLLQPQHSAATKNSLQ